VLPLPTVKEADVVDESEAESRKDETTERPSASCTRRIVATSDDDALAEQEAERFVEIAVGEVGGQAAALASSVEDAST
jgi:hypothetical protein